MKKTKQMLYDEYAFFSYIKLCIRYELRWSRAMGDEMKIVSDFKEEEEAKVLCNNYKRIPIFKIDVTL